MSNDVVLPPIIPYIPPPAGSITATMLAQTVMDSINEGNIPWQSGRWYGADATNLGDQFFSSTTAQANRHYATPVYIPYATTFSAIGLTVSTAAGTNMRMGIYDASATGRMPGNVLIASGDIPVTASDLTYTMSFSTASGMFVWLVAAFDGAAVFKTLSPSKQPIGGSGAGDVGPLANVYANRASLVMPATFGAFSLFPVGVPLLRLKVA